MHTARPARVPAGAALAQGAGQGHGYVFVHLCIHYVLFFCACLEIGQWVEAIRLTDGWGALGPIFSIGRSTD